MNHGDNDNNNDDDKDKFHRHIKAHRVSDDDDDDDKDKFLHQRQGKKMPNLLVPRFKDQCDQSHNNHDDGQRPHEEEAKVEQLQEPPSAHKPNHNQNHHQYEAATRRGGGGAVHLRTPNPVVDLEDNSDDYDDGRLMGLPLFKDQCGPDKQEQQQEPVVVVEEEPKAVEKEDEEARPQYKDQVRPDGRRDSGRQPQIPEAVVESPNNNNNNNNSSSRTNRRETPPLVDAVIMSSSQDTSCVLRQLETARIFPYDDDDDDSSGNKKTISNKSSRETIIKFSCDLRRRRNVYILIVILVILGLSFLGGLCASGSCPVGRNRPKETTNRSEQTQEPIITEPSTSMPESTRDVSLTSTALPTTVPTVPALGSESKTAATTWRPAFTPTLAPVTNTETDEPIAASSPTVVPTTNTVTINPETIQPDAATSDPASPTLAPTSSMRGSVTPTEASFPTSSPTPAGSILEFIRSISFVSRIEYPVSDRPLSAEEQALAWLIEDDPLQLTTDTAAERLRLQQRFALLSIWFQQTVDTQNDLVGWVDTNTDECTWEGIACERLYSSGAGFQNSVTEIRLVLDRVRGTIPADLALLTDISIIDLDANILSGTIPSSLSALKNIHRFEVAGNMALTGTIPESYSNWADIGSYYVYGTGIVGTMPFCSSSYPNLDQLVADCSKVNCPCCTACCSGGYDECVSN